MQAVIFNKYGGPEVLEVANLSQPKPDKKELLVRVRAAALNRADLLQRRGKYDPPKGGSPILGLEIAGDVVALGEQTIQFAIGDKVFGLVGGGGYAEYCVIDEQMAMTIPDGFSYVEAAAIPEAFLVANEAVFTLGQLQAGETILIHAGGSGVGTACIQLAHQAGNVVFTTVGSDAKISKVKTLGADHIINYKQQDFAAEISTNVDVIIDFIGADYLARNLQLLKPGGRLIQLGLMGGAKTEIDLGLILRNRLQIKGFMMRTRTLEDKRTITARFKQRWFSLLAQRSIHPVIDSVFDLTQVQAAHSHMENNANTGKIVLTIP